MTAPDATRLRVGFVGLGTIGAPMALRLATAPADRGLEVTVFDVAAEPCAALADAGATVADGVADLAAAVDVLCVMVRDDDQVREVMGQVLGAARDGLVVVLHSTVAPGTPFQLSDTAARHGVTVLDAPVSGGAVGAAEGTLAILVGGDERAFAVARPALEVMGGKVVHVGPVGAGTRFKLARNLLQFVSLAAATEAQRLAEAAGLDLRALGEVVRHTDAITGGAGAVMHRDTAAPLAADDFWHGVLSHVAALGEKDLGFAIELADDLGVDVPLAREALHRLRTGLGL